MREHIVSVIVRRILLSEEFRADLGFRCPYCKYWSAGKLPVNAHSLAIHILRHHRDKIADLLLDFE